MNITSFKENKQKQKIIVTYKLSETKELLQFNLLSKEILYKKFSESYLRIDNPYKHFNLDYRKDELLDLKSLRIVLKQLIDEPTEHVTLDVIKELSQKLDQIKQDLQQRLINLSDLPLNPKFTNDCQKDLIAQIEEINKETTEKLQTQNKSWQLLYVVLTTYKQQKDGKDILIVKLGKTNYEIKDYILKLKKTYREKIEFKALFAQRLYTPENSVVDAYFHKELLKLIPNSKLYFKGYEDNNLQFQLHYEFYYLTEEFVDNFRELLQKFMDKYKKNDTDDSQLTDRVELQQDEQQPKQIQHSGDKQSEPSLSDLEITNSVDDSNTRECQTFQFYEASTLNLQDDTIQNQQGDYTLESTILYAFNNDPNNDQKQLIKVNQSKQLSNDTTQQQTVESPKKVCKLIPENLLNLQMSEHGKEVIREASKLAQNNKILMGMLYLAQLKRESIKNQNKF